MKRGDGLCKVRPPFLCLARLKAADIAQRTGFAPFACLLGDVLPLSGVRAEPPHMAPMNIVLTLVFLVLGVGLIFALVRLVKGPSLPDRVVAIDLIAYVSIGFAIVYAIASNKPDFLEVALVLGLIAFLGTVALARFVERRNVVGEDKKT
jgi:multicomponent Na+:H+ antiporter subunit F